MDGDDDDGDDGDDDVDDDDDGDKMAFFFSEDVSVLKHLSEFSDSKWLCVCSSAGARRAGSLSVSVCVVR